MASDSTRKATKLETYLDEHELRALARQVKSLKPEVSADSDASRYGRDVDKYISIFRCVIRSCSLPQLSATHQVAAWNTLSTFIDQTASETSPALRTTLWIAQLWQQSLHVFLMYSHNARPKSIKQLLDSLTKSAQGTKDDASTSTHRRDAFSLLAGAILKRPGCTQWPARPCTLLLSSLLRKDVISLRELPTLTGHETIDQAIDDLTVECMQMVAASDGSSAAAQLLTTLLDKADADSNAMDDGGSLWSSTLLRLLTSRPEQLDVFKQHLMPVLFTRSKDGFLVLLSKLGYAQFLDLELRSTLAVPDLRILLATIEAGRRCSLISISETSFSAQGEVPLSLPVNILSLLLQHADRDIRCTGLSLLIQSDVISRPFPLSTYTILRTALPHLHADTDLNFRSELFSHTQKLFDRMRASINKSAMATHQIENDFLRWYQKFLLIELRPSASYQRHISALRCLEILAKSGIDPDLPSINPSKTANIGGTWRINMKVITNELEQVLLQLLFDPFDDVRTCASSILDILFSAGTTVEQRQRLFNTQLSAEQSMLASGRADQADTVAHLLLLRCTAAATDVEQLELFELLLQKVDTMLNLAAESLPLAVQGGPLHGYLIGLRYLLLRTNVQALLTDDTFRSLVSIEEQLWYIVRPVLCDDAPEGFLPEDMVGAGAASSKEVLSYCWRALKESSQLGETMLMMMKKDNRDFARIVESSITELTFTQLAELRHRGAFSTVAQTWTQCCTTTQTSQSLDTLFERALMLIKKATINTRRSAGMPSIVSGILIAADHSGALFEHAFATLIAVARELVQAGLDDESSLPQVHAINCLKDIFKSMRLAVRSEHYVPKALQLAADSLPSKAWAIRNCGLMLFRAVIDRLLGTNDSYEDNFAPKNVMDFQHRTELLDQILLLLPNEASSFTNEGVFPALQLLQNAHLPQDRVEVVHAAIIQLLSNESWLIRDKAARTLMTLMKPDIAGHEIRCQLETFKNSVNNHNKMHGWLLCLKHLTRINSEARHGSNPSASLGELQVLAQEVCEASRSAHLSGFDLSVSEFGSHQCTSDEKAVAILTQDVPYDGIAARLEEVQSSNEVEPWLQTQIISITKSIELYGLDKKTLRLLQDWLLICETTIDQQTSVFPSETIAESIANIAPIIPILYQHDLAKETILRICVLLYDLMQDDEEEIRVTAAASAWSILALRKNNCLAGGFEPQVASQKLLAFMLAYGSHVAFVAEASLERAFKMSQLSADALAQFVEAEARQDTTLFAQEKQNLYVDEALEAKAWSTFVRRLPCTSIAPEPIAQLVLMVDKGLDLLIHKAETTAPEVLGWSSLETTFVLGLRVLYGAETLLHFSQQQIKLSIRPSSLTEKVLKLQAAADKAQLYPVWRSELDRVAKIAAVASFSAIQSLINGVVGELQTATTLQ